MPSVRIRQSTPFGNMHVQVSFDPVDGTAREVFAQLGKGGDVANSDLEAICRMLSLWLRSNGSLEMAMEQLNGIGSSLSVPTKDGRIMSLADGLECALQKYVDSRETYGYQRMMFETSTEKAMPTRMTGGSGDGEMPQNVRNYKIKCPSCSAKLAFEEGCVKCYDCGFSQC
jgi:ribonucleoside-diphosphate reductase alpha chain